MAKQPAPGKSGNQFDTQRHEKGEMKSVSRVAGKMGEPEPYADHTRHHELRRETKGEGMHSSHAEHRSEVHHKPE